MYGQLKVDLATKLGRVLVSKDYEKSRISGVGVECGVRVLKNWRIDRTIDNSHKSMKRKRGNRSAISAGKNENSGNLELVKGTEETEIIICAEARIETKFRQNQKSGDAGISNSGWV